MMVRCSCRNDNPSGNRVIAYDRAADGSLHQRATYQTGARGGVLAGSVFDHQLRSLSAKPVVTADRGNAPFAADFDSYGHLVVAEAGHNSVATFALGRNGRFNLVSRAATGQAATCWIVGTGTKVCGWAVE
jgi:hypothetical protein